MWHEILFFACTETEEHKWRSEIQTGANPERQRIRHPQHIDVVESSLHILDATSSYHEGARSGSSIYGVRGDSRFGDLPPTISPVSCIVKNTHNLVKDASDNQYRSSSPPKRSLSSSYSNTDSMVVLAPERVERIRLEKIMADIWTREGLPYPAMASTRSAQILRSSANSVIRKLSKTSSASRTSVQTTGTSGFADVELYGGNEDPFVDERDFRENRIRIISQCQKRKSMSELSPGQSSLRPSSIAAATCDRILGDEHPERDFQPSGDKGRGRSKSVFGRYGPYE